MPRDNACTAFAIALDRLAPNQSLAEQARLFNGRATRLQVHHWRHGHAKPPQWAIDHLAELARAIGEIIATIVPSDGGKSANNIGRWHEKNRAEKSALSSKRDSADV